ncbi:DUF222 domain-containing protein, partial [Actinomycetospora sp.]|uniref:DUF222 domain-containing protein n=1 Tax=Actinomycetospora sp. TaxID=1872135 RepID=UPI002F422DC0
MAVMVGDAVAPDDGGPPLELAAFNEELPDDLLLALDPASVPGEWADAGMAAAFRAENHWAWARSRWTWEAWRATAGTTERVAERPRPGKIPAASLGWSEQYGATQIEFARQILIRLPALGEAMREGWLEERKAAKFVSIVAELDDAQARLVVERLLGRAPGWTYAQLQDRIEAEAKAVDPGWAEARQAAAVARRRLLFRAAPSGSTELCGLDLPPEPAQDAYDRIVALADVVGARLRAAGRDAPRGPVQTEVLLVLTGPDGAGLWDDDVIELVLARFTDPGPDQGPEPDGEPGNGPDGSPDSGPDDRPDGGSEPGPEGGPDDLPDGGSEPGPDSGPDDGPGPDGAPEGGPEGAAGPDSPPESGSAGRTDAEDGDFSAQPDPDAPRPGENPEDGPDRPD